MFSGMANLGGLQADRVMEMETPVRQFHFCHLWHQHHCHCNCKFYCCHCPVVIVIFVIVNCSSYGVTCLVCTAVLTVLKYNHHHFYNVFLCQHHFKDVLKVLIFIKSSSLSPFLKSTHSKIIITFIRSLHSKTKYSL